MRNSYIWKALRRYEGYFDNIARWVEVLRSNPSPAVLERIAQLLALHGYEPDENGFPLGESPPPPYLDPRVFLKIISVRIDENDNEVQYRTWEEMADILEAATLIWANIPISYEKILELYPLADPRAVRSLLSGADLEKFWKRPGVGLTAQDIRERWEKGKAPAITGEQMRKMIDRAGPGTYP